MVYSSTSCIATVIAAMLVFVSWLVVAGRLRNIGFALWIVVPIVALSGIPMLMVGNDLYRQLYYDTHRDAVMTILFKTMWFLVCAGAGIPAHWLVGLAFPGKMAASSVEPTITTPAEIPSFCMARTCPVPRHRHRVTV